MNIKFLFVEKSIESNFVNKVVILLRAFFKKIVSLRLGVY